MITVQKPFRPIAIKNLNRASHTLPRRSFRLSLTGEGAVHVVEAGQQPPVAKSVSVSVATRQQKIGAKKTNMEEQLHALSIAISTPAIGTSFWNQHLNIGEHEYNLFFC